MQLWIPRRHRQGPTTPSSCLLLAAAAAAALGTAAACSDDANPASPSALSSPAAPSSGGPLARTPSSPPPAGRATLQPVASAGDVVDTVAPGDARYGPNAYDFFAHVDSGMLHVALVEDAMATMRTASQPHRMRLVEVYHVTSEPRHVLQTHGDPLYTGTVRLSGRLELPPIAVESCAPHEWIVVTAAELSDDRYDGWRNAPCPQPGGAVVGSDGSGPGWERSERGAPERDFPPEPEKLTITNLENKSYERGAVIEAFRIMVTGGDDVTVAVSGLPPGLAWSSESRRVSGTVAADAPARAYRVTVTANDGTNDAVTATFTITIRAAGGGMNRAPEIVVSPGIKSYQRGQTIDTFRITVTDPDDDTVRVTVLGLPSGLTYSLETGMVSGTVAVDAAAQDYPVRVTANDGTNDAVTATFTITITEGQQQPPPNTVIAGLSDNYNMLHGGGANDDRVSFTVEDPDPGRVTISVSGLPPGLEFDERVYIGGSGAETYYLEGRTTAAAEVRGYPVTVTADDGGGRPVTRGFTITVTRNTPPGWENLVSLTLRRGRSVEGQQEGQDGAPVLFTVTDPDAETGTMVWRWSDVNRRPVTPPRGLTHTNLFHGNPIPGGTRRFRIHGFLPADTAPGFYNVDVTLSDRVNSVNVGVAITITE